MHHQPAMGPFERWEYTAILISGGANIEPTLAPRGELGWELVSLVPAKVEGDTLAFYEGRVPEQWLAVTEFRAVLKRRKLG